MKGGSGKGGSGTGGPCKVEVDVQCTTPDGLDCRAITPPPSPNGLDCEEILVFKVEVSNIGQNDIDVTRLDLDLDGFVVDLLLDLVQTNPLEPGDTELVEYKAGINICVPGEAVVKVFVEAEPPDPRAGMCRDDDEFKFTIDGAPQPTPP